MDRVARDLNKARVRAMHPSLLVRENGVLEGPRGGDGHGWNLAILRGCCEDSIGSLCGGAYSNVWSLGIA